MEFRKTSGAQADADRAPLSETEVPQKTMVAPMPSWSLTLIRAGDDERINAAFLQEGV